VPQPDGKAGWDRTKDKHLVAWNISPKEAHVPNVLVYLVKPNKTAVFLKKGQTGGYNSGGVDIDAADLAPFPPADGYKIKVASENQQWSGESVKFAITGIRVTVAKEVVNNQPITVSYDYFGTGAKTVTFKILDDKWNTVAQQQKPIASHGSDSFTISSFGAGFEASVAADTNETSSAPFQVDGLRITGPVTLAPQQNGKLTITWDSVGAEKLGNTIRKIIVSNNSHIVAEGGSGAKIDGGTADLVLKSPLVLNKTYTIDLITDGKYQATASLSVKK